MATVSHTPPPTAPRTAAPGPLQLAGQFTLGVLLLAAVGLLGRLVFGSLTADFKSADATRADERAKILVDRQSEDFKYLHDQPSWFSKDKGLVRVPIEEAMRMTLATLQANRPHVAYPIALPLSDNGAPTSPDKGFGSNPGVTTNPTASNPTVGHPVPTPAPNPTPTLPPGVKAPTESTPAPVPAAVSPAPAASPAAPVPTPAAVAAPAPLPTATPAPSASAAPTAAETPANNVSNPGSAPIPGKEAQPMPTPAPEVTATPAAQPAPLVAPAASAPPAPTPTPAPAEPAASPAGTP